MKESCHAEAQSRPMVILAVVRGPTRTGRIQAVVATPLVSNYEAELSDAATRAFIDGLPPGRPDARIAALPPYQADEVDGSEFSRPPRAERNDAI
jgi:hypothetical protein